MDPSVGPSSDSRIGVHSFDFQLTYGESGMNEREKVTLDLDHAVTIDNRQRCMRIWVQVCTTMIILEYSLLTFESY